MTDDDTDEGPGGMGAIEDDEVTQSDAPGGMSGIPDADDESDRG